jgi:glycosyltransferase involved in cell wall biosynthesis
VGKNLDDQIVPLPASPTSGGGEQGPLPAGGGGGGEGKANCLALPRRNGAGVQASHWTGWGGEKENPFLAQYPQLAGARIVLYLSRLDPKKNVEGLLRAFSLLGKPDPANPPSTMSRAIWEEKARETRGHGLMLVIAGEGEPGYVAGLHRLARELGLGEQVLWVGQLGGDVKAAAYAAAKIFALPSFSENFGIAAAEALSAGLPCVLGKGVAISGEVAEAGAGLAVAPEPKAIADALRKLLEDENLRADMGRRAAELAAERYTLEAMGTRLKELYSRILSEKQSEQIE